MGPGGSRGRTSLNRQACPAVSTGGAVPDMDHLEENARPERRPWAPGETPRLSECCFGWRWFKTVWCSACHGLSSLALLCDPQDVLLPPRHQDLPAPRPAPHAQGHCHHRGQRRLRLHPLSSTDRALSLVQDRLQVPFQGRVHSLHPEPSRHRAVQGAVRPPSIDSAHSPP
ncbi:hypothetical protein BXZ70DRAFT_314218 [Cristinia sonorae]|uniref:Uncharacterized protein n=1 Tax=Cristinia sonorae TaxID=1940300 RepID=A0A8K0ULN5_9AGAR|nr:hypothetical protein BXZ70DRAFT_314218 [Cristinia sonorae]